MPNATLNQCTDVIYAHTLYIKQISHHHTKLYIKHLFKQQIIQHRFQIFNVQFTYHVNDHNYMVPFLTTEKFSTRRIQMMSARFKVVNTVRNRINA